MDTPGQRLQAARKARGFKTAKEAAVFMGVPIPTYGMHEIAKSHLPAWRADQYARVFHTTPEWLNYGRRPDTEIFAETVKLIGVNPENLSRVNTLPRTSEVLRAIEINLDHGLPTIFDGWLAYFEIPQGAPTTDLEDQLCLVAMPSKCDRDFVLCRLRFSAVKGRFHLFGLRTELYDQEIVWAAPILAITPP
jgi:hypothetical protein